MDKTRHAWDKPQHCPVMVTAATNSGQPTTSARTNVATSTFAQCGGLRSRNGQAFKHWPQLCEELAHAIKAHGAILDGEIVCLDKRGRSQFKSLLYRRDWPYFYAFDLLAVDGEDLREWPLVERKRRPTALIGGVPTRLLYVDHVEGRGKDFFKVACSHDLEGIVAKPAHGRYLSDGRRTNWLKIKNPDYTQAEGRHELFESGVGGRRGRKQTPLLELR